MSALLKDVPLTPRIPNVAFASIDEPGTPPDVLARSSKYANIGTSTSMAGPSTAYEYVKPALNELLTPLLSPYALPLKFGEGLKKTDASRPWKKKIPGVVANWLNSKSLTLKMMLVIGAGMATAALALTGRNAAMAAVRIEA